LISGQEITTILAIASAGSQLLSTLPKESCLLQTS